MLPDLKLVEHKVWVEAVVGAPCIREHLLVEIVDVVVLEKEIEMRVKIDTHKMLSLAESLHTSAPSLCFIAAEH